jgi:glycosyltransferase involved in cell wall biosynthesis
MISISYGVTVCNEITEIAVLVDTLKEKLREDDEIVIQYDEGSVTDVVMEYLNIMKNMHKDKVKVIGFPLNKDFASYKNNLKSHCKGDYIFQIDADEVPNEFLLDNLHEILESNAVDLIYLPRVNTVEGLTDEHIQKWRWNVDEKGRVNWPDYQTRIYKNTDDINWMNKVHERITGYDTFSNFPADENYCLYHHKQIKRQEEQNEFYETI